MAAVPDVTYQISRQNLDYNHAFHGAVTNGNTWTIMIEDNTPRVWELLKATSGGELWYFVDWDGATPLLPEEPGAHRLPATISARSFRSSAKGLCIHLLADGADVEYTLTLVE